ncbi:Spc98 family-domain-containing protein [Syncephalis pseudoplumigaleata]|uniref:Spindle pole body component n=1 Tax=Syncephalis pseudoplumigaleata TaxID=1712513 RepID=A0A4P9Z1L0_9FUNG|nr:Spc98 family-domain-containing protein [Syncephalis pseudoplumigaleata]|eukprot:RKP26377.1 Spc98 family-domain-containing protein [Syncephalis pseudoplumigaleata]
MDETRLNKIAADLATVGEAAPGDLPVDLMSGTHAMSNRMAAGVYSRTGGVRTSYPAGIQPYDLEKVTATLFQTTRVVSGSKHKGAPRLTPGAQAKIKGTVKDAVGFTCSPLQSRMRRLSNENMTMDDGVMSIGTLKVHLQEQAIIDDLLYVMMGIEGKYIDMTVHEGEHQDDLQSATFTVDETLDPSLNDVVQRILPLASHYITIQSFIDSRAKFEYGLVNHALCAAIREILKEYLVLIAQLERDFRSAAQQFTIQKLWYHSHLSLRTMGVLGALVQALARATSTEEYQDARTAASEHEVILPLRAKGGGVLGALAERMLQLYGDDTTRKLYSHLLERASVPYFGMLDAWIRYGEIRDPDMAVPAFLEPLKMKILLAGKYLNVIRECGISTTSSERMQELEQGAELQDGATLAAAKGEVMRTLNGTR